MFELYNDLLIDIEYNKKYYSKDVLHNIYLLKFIKNKKEALFLSCKYNYLSITKILLQEPTVHLNIENKILQKSIDNGHYKIVKLLLKYKYYHNNNNDIVIDYCCYSLMMDKYSYHNIGIHICNAVINGNLKILKLFINHIKFKYINPYDFIKHPKIIKYFIKKGYDFKNCDSALINSIKKQYLRTAKILIKNYPNMIKNRNNYALQLVCRNGNFKLLKLMLKVNPSIKFHKNVALRFAITYNQYKIAKFLLKYNKIDNILKYYNLIDSLKDNINIKTKFYKLLFKYKHKIIINKLIKIIINKNFNTHNLIYIRILLINEENIEKILSNIPNSLINNLLNYYLLHKMKNILLLILKHIDKKVYKNNHYIVKMSCECGYLEIIELLLKNEYIDPCVDNNYTLNIAFENEYYQIVILLLNDKRILNNKNHDSYFKKIIDNKLEVTLNLLKFIKILKLIDQ
jgi:hypothetical protein